MTRAEKRRDFSKFFYLNLNAGINLNHTDLATNKFAPELDTWKLGYGGYFGWQFAPIWGVRGQITNGLLTGYKDNERLLQENFGFDGARYEAEITDASLQLTINLSNLISGYNDRAVDFFLATGVGNAQWATTSYNLDTGEEWRNNGNGNDVPMVEGDEYGTEKGLFNDRTRTFMIPAGFGARIHIAEKWDITAESQLKFVDTDRLDTWVKGAAPIKWDMYSYNSLGVQFRFGGDNVLKKMDKNYETVLFDAQPDPLEAHGGKVKVTVTGTFPEKYFHPKAAMKFQPVLKHDGGEIPLKSVTLKGQDVPGEGILIPYEGGTFTYEDELDYTPEMKASELMVTPVIFVPKASLPEELTEEVIGNYKNLNLPQTKLADGVIITPIRFSHDEEEILAAHGYEEVTILTDEATLYFFINRHDLNWNVPMNKKEESKQKRDALWDFVRQGYEIKEINIDGWASPEGEETFNEGLSERRSNTAHTYMISNLKKIVKEMDTLVPFENPGEDITWNVAHHGPDWNGFLTKVRNSDIEDKNMILNVINSAETPAKKEQEIRNMIVIYPTLEEDILPPLRRAEMVVNVYEPKKSEQEIMELALNNPRELDNKELLYAATLYDDNESKLAIYKSAINIYPDNYKGYANAAVIEIEMGDLNAAKGHLETAASLEPNSGEVHNNLGVVYAMQGDYAKAKEHFEQAQQLGEDASYNLGIIMITEGDYSRALTLFGDKDCDYNVALAQILAENYSAAENTLNCAPKDANTYYLMAVLGARTDNTSMLYENLASAVKANPSLKEEAAMDREFIDYFNEPEFQAIVE